MEIRYSRYGGEGVMRMAGEIDSHTAPKLRAALTLACDDERIRRLTFEMSGVTFMDSSGIGVLIGGYKRLKKRNVQMSVSGLRGQADKLFRIAGLYQIFPVNDDLEV